MMLQILLTNFVIYEKIIMYSHNLKEYFLPDNYKGLIITRNQLSDQNFIILLGFD